ncbi:MAG TPA: hypothetical protein VEI50_04820 [Nitrospiraceae bacterium]|jgi:hypothetical protein|nr:hypothetical protein [Nitrospiraceae bacterium]
MKFIDRDHEQSLRKAPFCLALILLVAWLATGCSSQRGWAYSPTQPTKQAAGLAKTLAVVPFIDQRPPHNSNNIGLWMIPLMPFGWQELNAPETIQSHIASGLWQFRPTEDMAKALALEVQNRHVFKEAFFTFRESDGELILRGTLLSTGYQGTLYSYGLSIYGQLLWVLGLPAGKIKNDLSIELRLENQMSGQVMWSKQYKADHDEGVYWAYAIPSDFWYDTMLKELMPAILLDLEGAINNPH